jgi:sirohydrochlorin ferrochelatase
MTVVVAAHGTRDPAGVAVAHQLVDAIRAQLPGRPVVLAFVDVLGPGVRDVVAGVPGPVTVVPTFLSSGYHVRVDVPREVTATGRNDVTISAALGPHPLLVTAMWERLRAAGWRRGDAVVLAAAGSSDRRAVADVRAAAGQLSGSGSWPPVHHEWCRWSLVCGRPGSRGSRSRRGCLPRECSTAGSARRVLMWWPRRWVRIRW